jgi:hypothetical protein
MSDAFVRLTPDTPTLARELGDLLRVGPGFVHIDPRIWRHDAVARIGAALRLQAPEALPELIPLYGAEPSLLPGAVLEPAVAPSVRPAALWTARTVYAADEAVDVAVLAPPIPGRAAGASVSVDVRMAGGRDRTMSVQLYDGVGRLRLPPMPPGAWSVALDGCGPLRFTVQDRVAGLPLSAQWIHRQVRRVASVGDVPRHICAFSVLLHAYDHPVSGPVHMTVTNPRLDDQLPLGVVEADAWGVARGSAELVGVGPFVVGFECEGLGGRQARLTVPLPTKTADASLPDHSFVPSADRFLAFEPLRGAVEVHGDKLPPLEAPVAIIVAADACRRERVHVVRPPRAGVEVAWDGAPGEKVRITTGTAGKVLLTAWVGRGPGPHAALEENLRGQLSQITGELLARRHLVSVFEACGGAQAQTELLELLAGAPARPRAGRHAGVAQDLGGVVAPLPVWGDESHLLRMEIVTVDGDALVQLPPAPVTGLLTVEVAVCGPDGGWAASRIQHVVGPGFEVRWEVPAFLADGDPVTGRLVVTSDVDASLVRLTRDQRPVERTLESAAPGESARPAPLGVPLPRRARIGVGLRPGLWVAEVECPRHGGVQRAVAAVSEPGRRRATVRRFRVLEAGEVARRADGDGPLRVLASPRDEIERVSRSVLDAPYKTCESLAAMCIATAVRFAHGLGSRKRLGRLDEIVTTLEGLFEPGRGFAVRERHGPLDEGICEVAARHLVRLDWVVREVLAPRAPDEGPEFAALLRLLERAAALGTRAVRTLGLVLPPPPKTLRHADDAELLATMRPERMDIAAATARTRLKRRVSRMDVESIDPRAAARRHEGRSRSDRAFAARLLLRTGEAADVPIALEALTRALGDSSRSFLPAGGGFATEDAVALLLALHEVESASTGRVQVARSGRVHREEPVSLEVADAIGGEFDEVCAEETAWVAWETTAFDDLTDPAAPIQLSVHLRGADQRAPSTQFELGDLVEVHVGLGSPAQGQGYAHGDWVEVHLPPALIARSRPLGEVQRNVLVDDGGRRVRVELAGAHGAVIHTRAVLVTGSPQRPAVQRFAAGVRNVYDAHRGCGRLGLDITVFPRGEKKSGGLFGLFK